MAEKIVHTSFVRLSQKFDGKDAVEISVVGKTTFNCFIPGVLSFAVMLACDDDEECLTMIYFSCHVKNDCYYIPSGCTPRLETPHSFMIGLEELVELITFFIEERKIPDSECLKKCK